MKIVSKISLALTAILSAASITGFMPAHAQETATAIQTGTSSLSPANLSSIELYSDAQLAQLLSQLAATPLIWPDDLPSQGRGGTYWSLAHPNWPPLPATFGTPVWNLYAPSASKSSLSLDSSLSSASDSGSSFYLLDDIDYPPGPGGGGGTNVYTPSFQPMALPTTNDLWLEITGTTNTGTGITAYITIHPPWNITDGVWDIFATTNLAPTAWQWVYRTAPGETNIVITGLAYPNEFFTAASTNDTDGDGLSDAFEKYVSHTNPNLYSTDGTGMSDGWEWQHFGHTGIDPNGDPDGDQLSTYQEFLMNSQNYSPVNWNSFTNSVVGDGFLDYSGDGLANLLETSFGGNLMINNLTWKVNTSGDGLPDEYKTLVGLSPGSPQPAPGLPSYSKNPIQ